MRSLKDLGFGKVIITIRTITPIILILILILALIAFMSTTVFKYFIIIPKKIDRFNTVGVSDATSFLGF